MQDWQTERQWYTKQSLTQRQTWYSKAEADYDRVRPYYPDTLIDKAIAASELSPSARLLEIGCGPGVVTFPLRDRGFQFTCLEPNPHFYRLMQQKTAAMPDISLKNTTFEQWPVEFKYFDGVVAANSMHWVDPTIAYSKAAQALHSEGHLILFWHMQPEPCHAVFDLLKSAYADMPSLFNYEGCDNQRVMLKSLGQEMLDSGYFENVIMEVIPWSQICSTADYLALLGTFSKYLRLSPGERSQLFARLEQLINRELNGQIEVFSLCMLQVGRKKRDM